MNYIYIFETFFIFNAFMDILTKHTIEYYTIMWVSKTHWTYIFYNIQSHTPFYKYCKKRNVATATEYNMASFIRSLMSDFNASSWPKIVLGTFNIYMCVCV